VYGPDSERSHPVGSRRARRRAHRRHRRRGQSPFGGAGDAPAPGDAWPG